MVDVQFQEEQTEIYRSHRILGEEVVPGMVNALTKTGVVKNGKQAEYILFGIIIVAVVGTGFFTFLAFRGPTSAPTKPVPGVVPVPAHPAILP